MIGRRRQRTGRRRRSWRGGRKASEAVKRRLLGGFGERQRATAERIGEGGDDVDWSIQFDW